MMNSVKFEASRSFFLNDGVEYFTLALVHFYSRVVVKRTSIYRKVEKNTVLYAKKKTDVKY